MKDPQSITIGLLLATAVILAAMLVGNYATINSVAYADTPVKQGDYILGTGALTDSTDLVYVLDVATRRLNVYFANVGTVNKRLDILDSIDLEKAFEQ